MLAVCFRIGGGGASVERGIRERGEARTGPQVFLLHPRQSPEPSALSLQQYQYSNPAPFTPPCLQAPPWPPRRPAAPVTPAPPLTTASCTSRAPSAPPAGTASAAPRCPSRLQPRSPTWGLPPMGSGGCPSWSPTWGRPIMGRGGCPSWRGRGPLLLLPSRCFPRLRPQIAWPGRFPPRGMRVPSAPQPQRQQQRSAAAAAVNRFPARGAAYP